MANGNCGIVKADKRADSAQLKKDFVILSADQRVVDFAEVCSPPTCSDQRFSTERKVAANRKTAPPPVIDVPLNRIAVVEQSERTPDRLHSRIGESRRQSPGMCRRSVQDPQDRTAPAPDSSAIHERYGTMRERLCQPES